MVDLSPPEAERKPAGEPDLAVAMVVGSERERAQRTLDAIAAQTAADRIEAVVVDTRPDLPALEHPPGLNVRAEFLPDRRLDRAKVRAATSTTAPTIAYVEDHAAPDAGWAEALIDAFEERPWAAVGYAFRNANPRRWMSRAGFIADYVTWAEPLGRRLPPRLPCNNCAYDRGLLLARGDRLEILIGSDVVLQEALRADGHELGIEPRAVVYHENNESFRSLMRANFHHCRLIAGRRVSARGLGRLSRPAYAAGALLLVPPLKLARDLVAVHDRPRLWRRFVEALPIVLAVHVWASVGEALGYISVGNAERDFARYELDVSRASDVREQP
jgi:hypothetical protein